MGCSRDMDYWDGMGCWGDEMGRWDGIRLIGEMDHLDVMVRRA